MTNSRPRDPSDPANDDGKSNACRSRARKFLSNLTPELFLRWLVVRDGPLLPGGRLVGMATAPVEAERDVLQVAKRIVEAWPAGFILPSLADPKQRDLPGLVIRSLALSGMIRRALVSTASAGSHEWLDHLEMMFLIRFPFPKVGAEDTQSYTPLSVIPIDSLAEPDEREIPNGSPWWDLSLLDETDTAIPISVIESVRQRTRSLLLAPMPNMPQERAFGLISLFRRAGSFSLDTAIVREFHRMIGEFETAKGRISECDIQILRQAVDEIRELDPDHWNLMMDALGEQGRAVLRRWLRTGCTLNSDEADAVAYALHLAGPLSRAKAEIATCSVESPPAIPTAGDQTSDLIAAPVTLDDIFALLVDTAQLDGVLQPTDEQDVYSIDTGSGATIRITASKSALEWKCGHSSGGCFGAPCEFASYGGSGFDSLLELLPGPSELPNWLHRVEVDATEEGITVKRIAYVASCIGGDRTVLSLRALNGAVIDPTKSPSRAFIASVERYLRQDARSELARIKSIDLLDEANIAAARRQRAFALELAAALTQHIEPDDSTGVRECLEALAGRQHPMLVTLDRARLFRHSPNLIDIGQGVPDDGSICLNVPPALLVASASEGLGATSWNNAEVSSAVFRQEVDRLLDMCAS